MDVFSTKVAYACEQAGPCFIDRKVEEAVQGFSVHALPFQVRDVDTQEQPLTRSAVEFFVADIKRSVRRPKHEGVVELQGPRHSFASVGPSAAREAVFHVVQEPGWYVLLAVDTTPKLCVELLGRKRLVPCELGDDSDEVGWKVHLLTFQFL